MLRHLFSKSFQSSVVFMLRLLREGVAMRAVFGNPVATAIEIQGHFVPGRDKIVPPLKWVGMAKHLWPKKTAAHLASIAGKDERTGKRWLEGDHEPPGVIIAAMVAEMFKREGE